MKRIYFTVTNDLTYDQRMNRICTSLAKNGYEINLVGRRVSTSKPLGNPPYRQRRLRCWINRGKLFYAEFNIRLFFYLLFRKMDGICAIDLDTILPCLYISKWKRIPRIYDAHELFTGLKEVETRPFVKKMWMAVERKAIPRFQYGYTVSEGIAEEIKRRYNVDYRVIRNMSRLRSFDPAISRKRQLLYLGAVNEARAFEYLIPALKDIPYPLVICGDGNFMEQLRDLIKANGLEDRVELKGMLLPDLLWQVAQTGWIGLGVAENTGINQYLALPNKFFDYIHAGLPQVAMNFPEYRKINREFEVAVLIDEATPETIANAVNNLINDAVLYGRLRENCLRAREQLNWEQEEKKLLDFYQLVFKR